MSVCGWRADADANAIDILVTSKRNQHRGWLLATRADEVKRKRCMTSTICWMILAYGRETMGMGERGAVLVTCMDIDTVLGMHT